VGLGALSSTDADSSPENVPVVRFLVACWGDSVVPVGHYRVRRRARTEELAVKRCLILQGGGLRSAFAAGACFALFDLGISSFELAFAVSASVPTLAYFLAGQCKEAREIWENWLCTKRLIHYENLLFGWSNAYSRRPVVDLNYLVSQVFQNRFPLRTEQLLASRTKAYFVATDAEDYLPRYFEPDSADIYKIMRACLALPGAVPEKPIVDGKTYVDGAVRDALPVAKALRGGADRFLVVLTIPPGTVPKRPTALERLAARQYFRDNPDLRDICFRQKDSLDEALELLGRLEQRIPDSVLVIRPNEKLPAGRITRNRSKVVETLEIGYRAVLGYEDRIRRVLALS
jgi:predicted patatin/cPLA2 family phospholipase